MKLTVSYPSILLTLKITNPLTVDEREAISNKFEFRFHDEIIQSWNGYFTNGPVSDSPDAIYYSRKSTFVDFRLKHPAYIDPTYDDPAYDHPTKDKSDIEATIFSPLRYQIHNVVHNVSFCSLVRLNTENSFNEEKELFERNKIFESRIHRRFSEHTKYFVKFFSRSREATTCRLIHNIDTPEFDIIAEDETSPFFPISSGNGYTVDKYLVFVSDTEN